MPTEDMEMHASVSAICVCSNEQTKSESEKNGAVGDRDGKKREQHEKVVNNFMQIKGEQ